MSADGLKNELTKPRDIRQATVLELLETVALAEIARKTLI